MTAPPDNNTDDALLLAYVYGELTASAAKEFEARVAADPSLRAEVEGARATLDLFGKDAAWGAASATDAPPPHLVDAILRSEALARTPQVREASVKKAALTTTSSSSFTAKMSRWLLGGGLLVGATAAVLLVVTRSASDAPPSLQKSLAAAEASAPPPPPAPPPAAAPVVEPTPPDAKADGTVDSSAGKDVAEKSADKKALARFDTGGGRAEAPAENKNAPADDLGGEDRARDGAVAHHHASAGPTSAALKQPEPAKPAPLQEAQKKQGKREAAMEEAKDYAKLERVASKTASSAYKNDDAEDKPKGSVAKEANGGYANSASVPGGGASSGSFAYGSATPTSPPATTAPMAPPPAKVSSSAARKKSAPMPDAKKDSYAGDSINAESADAPVVASDEDVAAQRRAILDSRLEKAKSSPKKGEMERSQRLQDSNLALASGFRELKAKNYIVALDTLQRAEHIDVDGALGAQAQLGQMQALLALKRAGEAARIAWRLSSRDIKVGSIVDAWMVGVTAAEQVGDDRLQRALWTRLKDDPAHKAAAEAALARLSAPALRAAPRQMDAEKAAAAPPAAAAEAPTSKE